MPDNQFFIAMHSRRLVSGTVGQLCLTIGVEVPDGLARQAPQILDL